MPRCVCRAVSVRVNSNLASNTASKIPCSPLCYMAGDAVITSHPRATVCNIIIKGPAGVRVACKVLAALAPAFCAASTCP